MVRLTHEVGMKWLPPTGIISKAAISSVHWWWSRRGVLTWLISNLHTPLPPFDAPITEMREC